MDERPTADARLERIEGRLDSIENQLDRMPTRDEMNARFAQVPTRDEMNAGFAEMRQEMNDRSAEMREEMEDRFGHYRDEVLEGVRADGEQTRRHFDIVYEKMADLVRLDRDAVRAVEARVSKLEAGHEALEGRVERVELRLDAERTAGKAAGKKSRGPRH